MNCAILVVGSLLWEGGLRQHWRDRRLQLEKRQVVSAPIRYGRRSVTRADTFTMVIDPSTSSGDAILVPCIRSVETIGDLVEEAEALWRAERKVADGEGISAKWGCVGAFFSPDGLDNHVEIAWSSYFRSKASPILPIDEAGILSIPWPVGAADGTPADVDIILAAATRADADRPTVPQIADAWIGQDKSEERYFFLNVQHGIRTAEDSEIAARMAKQSPAWLGRGSYSSVLKQLSSEE